jgi:hypothetical protein
MALLTRADLLGSPVGRDAERVRTATASARLLVEARAPFDATFDIFLSHSTRDAREVRALKKKFERLGYSVYVDWVEDDDLDREQVTPDTAARLRRRIAKSRSLLVHASEGAKLSRWVPWELGIADGLQRRVGVLPVLEQSRATYKGSEYLALYPYVDFAPGSTTGAMQAWVRRSPKVYVNLRHWLRGDLPRRHD